MAFVSASQSEEVIRWPRPAEQPSCQVGQSSCERDRMPSFGQALEDTARLVSAYLTLYIKQLTRGQSLTVLELDLWIRPKTLREALAEIKIKYRRKYVGFHLRRSRVVLASEVFPASVTVHAIRCAEHELSFVRLPWARLLISE
jgi:KaiC/GvpD/RAD55 family RecA-like ATPase